MVREDLPEEIHAPMRALQGRVEVEVAADALFRAALKCRADGVPWPRDLDECHAILWAHLDRNEALRRAMVGPVDEEDGILEGDNA